MYAATAAATFPEFIPGQMLDELLPLRGASHRDVVRYIVEIPMRYAECFALLRDGRKVGLADKRKFVGWSDDDQSRSFLFRRTRSISSY